VAEIVWELFACAVERTGSLLTLIEWDAAVPEWSVLQSEAHRADAIAEAAGMSNGGLHRRRSVLMDAPPC
jgi:uncharacterized protein